MQVGILGFSKAGKTTLFNLLTDSREATGKFTASGGAHIGVATVPDPRLQQLRDLYSPRKFTPATVTYIDIPGVTKGEGAESLDLARLREADALMHVVRAFEDLEILHPDGSVDPARDVENLDLELILADMELVGRRVERLGQARKRGLSPDELKEQKLLEEVVMPALEAGTPLRDVDIDPEAEKLLRGYQLLSAKPMLLALNVDESRLAEADPQNLGLGEGAAAMVVSAPIEEEVSHLDPEEQTHFLEDLGLEEPSLHRIIRASYDWTVRKGSTARRSARVIHSDLERGFIRAEVVPYDDLVRLESLAACREQALLRLEGRDYLTRDGDVMHIRSGV